MDKKRIEFSVIGIICARTDANDVKTDLEHSIGTDGLIRTRLWIGKE